MAGLKNIGKLAKQQKKRSKKRKGTFNNLKNISESQLEVMRDLIRNN